MTRHNSPSGAIDVPPSGRRCRPNGHMRVRDPDCGRHRFRA
jgi:hypothetical protein